MWQHYRVKSFGFLCLHIYETFIYVFDRYFGIKHRMTFVMRDDRSVFIECPICEPVNTANFKNMPRSFTLIAHHIRRSAKAKPLVNFIIQILCWCWLRQNSVELYLPEMVYYALLTCLPLASFLVRKIEPLWC